MFARDYFLKKYNIVLDPEQLPEEQILQMRTGFGVKESESGGRPYIFISYAHRDSCLVLPAIKALQDKGYPVWYDAGIVTGIAWRDYVVDKVRDAVLMITFVSQNAVASENCRTEVWHALEHHVPILAVKLDQSEFTLDVSQHLHHKQEFLVYPKRSGDVYIRELAGNSYIAEIAGKALAAYYEKKQLAEAEEAQLRRKAEEAKKAERKRKETGEQEQRRREKEIAELEIRYQALTQEIGNLAAAKERNDILAKLLKKEQSLRGAAERKLEGAQEQIDIMIAAEKKRNEPEQLSKEEKYAKEKLTKLYSQAKELLYTQKFEDYSTALRICKADMAQYTKQYRGLEKDRQSYINDILATMYHDARTLEKRSAIKSYAIYHALPAYYEDVKRRRNDAEDIVMKRAKWTSLVAVVQYLVIHILLVKSLFTLSMSLWADFLLFLGPMLIMMGIWWVCNHFWIKTDNPLGFEIKLYFALVLITCSVLAMIVDPFLYPEMSVILKILISMVGNGFLNIVAIGAFLVMIGSEDDASEDFIDPFGEK